MKRTTQIRHLRNDLEQLKGRRAQVAADLKQCKHDLRHAKRNQAKHEQAREIVKTVGLATQQQLEYHFSDIVTSALDAVFPNPYALSVSFVERRGRTECDLQFARGDDLLDPLDATGGGAVDVASFALRVAAWSMQQPRPRPLIVLDEPFKHLSTDLQPLAGKMLREISEKLGIQLLVITHEEELEDCADRVFVVRQSKGVSRVKAL